MSQPNPVSISLPASVVESMSALALKEGRSVSDLLADMVASRTFAADWNELKQSGRSRAQQSKYVANDVVALVREVRAELSAQDSQLDRKSVFKKPAHT